MKISSEKDVRPILKAHCFHCHGEHGKTKAGLDLRLQRLILAGGENGSVVAPGDRHGSPLFQLIESGEMPEGNGEKLSARELEIIGRWIDEGAPVLRPEPSDLHPDLYLTEEDRAH